jgi:hypothetical protein
MSADLADLEPLVGTMEPPWKNPGDPHALRHSFVCQSSVAVAVIFPGHWQAFQMSSQLMKQ